MTNKLGVWAFVIGLVLALVIAIFSATATPLWAVVVLAILGVVVGLLNVTDKEVQPFLVATIAFLLSFQSLNVLFTTLKLGTTASALFGLLSAFMAPAAAIVAIIALFKLARD